MSGPRGRAAQQPEPEAVEAILREAEHLARAEGLRGVAMRRIALALGISPGSIYYRLGDLDQVVLRVNARTLSRLRAHLAVRVGTGATPMDDALAVAEGYVSFVVGDPRLWGLVSEHTMPAGTAIPDWYAEELALTTGMVDRVLGPLVPDPGERRRSVAALWAGLQGIASLAVSGKLAAVDSGDPVDLARLLVSRYLGGPPRPTRE